MPIILALAVLFTGGASLAAESSLPGGLLYPVKVGVNERVGAMLAFSTEAKAEYESMLAIRRTEEMSQLVEKGEVSAVASESLQADFEIRASNFHERLAKLEADGKLGAAIEASSDFQARLASRLSVFANRVAATAGSVNAQALTAFSATIESERSRLAGARARLESDFAASASAEAQSEAEARLRAAESKIAETSALIESRASAVSVETFTSAQGRVDVAESQMVEAKARLEAAAYGEAFVLFNRAFFTAVEAEALITNSINRINLEEALDVNIGADTETDREGVRSESGASTETDANVGAGAEAGTETETGGANTNTEAETEAGVNIGL